MIRINLLPHREAKRKQAMKDFYALLVLGAILGGIVVLAVGGYLARQVTIQTERNNAIKAENTILDGKIKEIATLKEEIDALKARQQAVEDLQSDRNQPVYLMDALVKLTPAGIHLKGFKQEGQRVVITGFAQSYERVAEFLRNLGGGSEWLEKPELVGIRTVPLQGQKTGRKVSDFTINVGIKRARDSDADGKPDEPAGGAKAAAKPASAS